MITQIIINEDKDFSISNNYGLPEPFNSALIVQIFNIKPTIELINSLGISGTLVRKRVLKNYTRTRWNNLPYNKFLIPNAVGGYLFDIFNKPKNIF